MKLRTKTKAAIILLNSNYLVVCLLFLLCFYLISNYDFFELRTSYYLKKDKQLTWGQVDKKWALNGSKDDHGTLRFGYNFSFLTEDMGRFKGTSYSYYDGLKKSDSVRVEYVPWAPSYSRITRFDIIEKSNTTLYVSGIFFLSTILFFLYSLYRRLVLISLLKKGQIVPVQFHFADHIDWLIPDFNDWSSEWSWRDHVTKMTYSYKLEGEKKQQFGIIRFKLDKLYLPSHLGITRINKRPLLLTFLPKSVLKLIAEDNKSSN